MILDAINAITDPISVPIIKPIYIHIIFSKITAKANPNSSSKPIERMVDKIKDALYFRIPCNTEILTELKDFKTKVKASNGNTIVIKYKNNGELDEKHKLTMLLLNI